MMKTKRTIFGLDARVAAVALTLLSLVTSSLPLIPVGADNALLKNAPPFDFSNAFYLKNGVDFNHILGRPGNPDRPQAHWITDPSNTDPNRRGVRILETTGGWDKDGNLIYYSIMGDGSTPSPTMRRPARALRRFPCISVPEDHPKC
jgi:hypothetical protein